MMPSLCPCNNQALREERVHQAYTTVHEQVGCKTKSLSKLKKKVSIANLAHSAQEYQRLSRKNTLSATSKNKGVTGVRQQNQSSRQIINPHPAQFRRTVQICNLQNTPVYQARAIGPNQLSGIQKISQTKNPSIFNRLPLTPTGASYCRTPLAMIQHQRSPPVVHSIMVPTVLASKRIPNLIRQTPNETGQQQTPQMQSSQKYCLKEAESLYMDSISEHTSEWDARISYPIDAPERYFKAVIHTVSIDNGQQLLVSVPQSGMSGMQWSQRVSAVDFRPSNLLASREGFDYLYK